MDDPDGAGGYRGWANRLAERIAEIQGGLLYANLGIRGKLAREIRDEQLGPALEMKPDLATLFTGSNDMILRGFNWRVLRDDIEAMQMALIAGGATVLSFTLPDLVGVMPIGRLLVNRVKGMNDALKEASAATGAILVDFAAHPVGKDQRLWTEDRFHVNAEGHARIAAALGEALGLPGSDDSWKKPLTGPDVRSRWAKWSETYRWYRRHLLDHMLHDSASAKGRAPKRPRLEPVKV